MQLLVVYEAANGCNVASFRKVNVMKSHTDKLLAIAVISLVAVSPVFADLPPSVATDVAAAKTDMLAAIGIVISAMVAVWGLLKLASKLGWR
jgi:Fe2+ transport system protein B